MCAYFVVFHIYHYIVQVSSKPIPAFKVVIRTQQTVDETFLPSSPLGYKTKTKMSNSGCQVVSSPLAPLLHDRSGNREHLVTQIGNPAKAERLMHFGGSFVYGAFIVPVLRLSRRRSSLPFHRHQSMSNFEWD